MSGRSGGSGILAGFRSALETVALVMVVAVCGAMLYGLTRGGWPASVVKSVPAARAAASAAPLPATPLTLDGAQLEGSRSANVAIIEYSDFQCPYCGRFVKDTLPDLRHSYVDAGKVVLAFREFPLASLHAFARGAAEAAECAGQQGAFWKMHDLNFSNQKDLGVTTLTDRAKSLGLQGPAFTACLRDSAPAAVDQDVKTGTDLGVTGTPTFFLGVVQKDRRVKVLDRLVGAVPTEQFHTKLDEMLAQASHAQDQK